MSNNLYLVGATLKDGTKVQEKILAKNIADVRKKAMEHWTQAVQKIESIRISVKNYEGWLKANSPKVNNQGEWQDEN